LDQKVPFHPEVVDTELDDGEVVLLHLESKTYCLNLTGQRIWHRLKKGLTTDVKANQSAAEGRI
jgi:hypothetical protein